MKISKRLTTVSDLVTDNSKIIDVGCDHALLDIYLFKNKKNVKIIASDIKKGPLEQAKKNIEKYHCQIETVQGFGLDPMPPDIDTVIMTGLGGDTMIDILEKGKNKLKQINTIIVSPQSESIKLRKWLIQYYYVVDEIMIQDHHKYYLIEKYQKGKQNYTSEELNFGPILLQHKSYEFVNYYQSIIKEKQKIIKKIPFYKIKERFQAEKEIRYLQKVLKK